MAGMSYTDYLDRLGETSYGKRLMETYNQRYPSAAPEGMTVNPQFVLHQMSQPIDPMARGSDARMGLSPYTTGTGAAIPNWPGSTLPQQFIVDPEWMPKAPEAAPPPPPAPPGQMFTGFAPPPFQPSGNFNPLGGTPSWVPSNVDGSSWVPSGPGAGTPNGPGSGMPQAQLFQSPGTAPSPQSKAPLSPGINKVVAALMQGR